jgi:4-amino-4-deoxy-L-arabinose transferase-like glycosyltransferase
MGSARFLRVVAAAVKSPLVVFLVALTARLWVLSQLLPANAWQDFYRYNEPAHIAWSVVSGAGYSTPWADTLAMPTAQQPPLYPYLLAGIFKLAGSYSYLSLWIAVGLNAVFSALTAVAILRLGKSMFNTATGVLAAWIWSCWLYQAVVSIRLWESSLSGLLLTIGLLLFPELSKERRGPLWLAFGLLAGIAALTNTTLLAVFLFFWLWLWIDNRRRGGLSNRWMAASVAVCVLAVLPWTVRNYERFHRTIPIRDNFGLELWLGNHEGLTPVFDADFPILNPAEYNRLGEIRFMETKRDIALEFIGRHPGEFLQLTGKHFYKFWSAPEKTVWLPLSAIAWLGMMLGLRRKGFTAVPYAIVMIVFPLVYYITHVFSTYRHPIEPVILLLAAYAAVSAVESVAPRLLRRSSGVSGILLRVCWLFLGCRRVGSKFGRELVRFQHPRVSISKVPE